MEPRSYFDPPCEKNWTIEEMEEFFALQDARTYYHGSYVSDPNSPFSLSNAHMWSNESFAPRGIHLSHIVPPAQGWPIAAYCPKCMETTFILSPWAAKPKDGDYFRMNDTCISKGLSGKHVLDIFHPQRAI